MLQRLLDKNKTFKPLKQHTIKTMRLHRLAQQTLGTLGSGNMRTAVALPKGEDKNEWLAANTVDFFNEISLLYGAIAEFCTAETCPVMTAGKKVQYFWADGVKVKKPVKVSAPEYVDLLMSWVESQLGDEDLFPLSPESKFPRNFDAVVQKIFKRMFRVYAHIYHTHFEQLVKLGAEAHLNTSFKHFVYFTEEFGLVDTKEQFPLKELVERFLNDALDASGHEAKA